MDSDRGGGDGCFVVFLTAWFWVPVLVLIMWAVASVGEKLYRLAGEPVVQFVATHILPHWFDYLIWLLILELGTRLAIGLKEELTPPIRRLRIRRYWRKLDAEEQQRYLAARKDLDDAFREAMQNVKNIQNTRQ